MRRFIEAVRENNRLRQKVEARLWAICKIS